MCYTDYATVARGGLSQATASCGNLAEAGSGFSCVIVSVFVCVCGAMTLCDRIPGCTWARLAVAECALVIVDKQLQT